MKAPVNTHVFVRCLMILCTLIPLAQRAAAQTCVTAPTGAVNYYPAENNAYDFQSGRDGVLNGGATYAPGKVGQAFSFNGTSSFVSVPGTFGNVSQLTIEAWVKTDGTTGDFQAIVSSTAIGEFVHFQLNSGGNIAV